jgi:replicative DNA helicase
VVGSSLIEPDALSVTTALIYKASRELFEAGNTVTFESVAYNLSEKGMLADVGGLEFFDTLKQTTFVPDAMTFKKLCDDLAKVGQTRSLKQELTELTNLPDDTNPDLLLDKSVSIIYKASKGKADGILSITEAIDTAGQGRVPLTSSTLGGLDTLFGGGLVAGDYILVGARPSVGKSALTLQIGGASALNDHPTLIYSFEMSKVALVGRLGKMFTLDLLRESPLYMVTSPLTVEQIFYTTQVAQLTKNIEIVIIDYIGLIPGQRSTQTKNDFITHVSRTLQAMSRKLNVVLIVVSQLNREMDREGREPALHDLRDSGSLEQDADNIIFIHRPQKKEKTKIILAKHREGPIGDFQATFDAESGMFFDA